MVLCKSRFLGGTVFNIGKAVISDLHDICNQCSHNTHKTLFSVAPLSLALREECMSLPIKEQPNGY